MSLIQAGALKALKKNTLSTCFIFLIEALYVIELKFV